MAIVVGIDEAGLGPTLGPLLASGTAFRVPDDRRDDCLWKALSGVCSSSPSSKSRRLAIADSKLLYRSRESLAALERGVLVMLAVSGRRPKSVVELIDSVAGGVSDDSGQYPWYSSLDVSLPVEADVGDVGTRANAIRRYATDRNVEFIGAFCEPLLEAEFNRRVAKTRNKAAVLIGLVLRVIERVLQIAPDQGIRICVDRLGGRTHYRDVLMTAFATFEFKIVMESEDRSMYQLREPGRVVDIEFAVGGESRYLPVALASMFSKYLRELYMLAFNRYWSQKIQGLRPTAGYHNDADRWLREAKPFLDQLDIDHHMLVRAR